MTSPLLWRWVFYYYTGCEQKLSVKR
jgi:hypothetical protein